MGLRKQLFLTIIKVNFEVLKFLTSREENQGVSLVAILMQYTSFFRILL